MQNYFSLFGLLRNFDLDGAQLEKQYFAAQKQYHPDRLRGKDASERQQSIQQSMVINEAYEALKNPLKRAQHLLQLEGITQENVKASESLLMEIMELREALMEAANEADIDRITQENGKAIVDTLADLSRSFAASDAQNAAQLAMRLSYLTKLTDEIRIKKKALA